MAVINTFTISDASHGGSEDFSGQIEDISGLRIPLRHPYESFFHPIACTILKPIRVSYASFVSYTISAVVLYYRWLYIKLSNYSFFPHISLLHELLFALKSLFKKISTFHKVDYFRLHGTFVRMHDSYESPLLNISGGYRVRKTSRTH